MKHKIIFNKIEKILNVITRHPEHTFWIIALLHYNLSLIIFLQIFLFPVNTANFKLGVTLWSLMMFGNILFNGSFFIRLEKYLLRERSWEGIYEMLPYCNISKTKENIHKVFHYTSLITYYIILGKIYIFL
jgi:hypothetical protein